MTNNTIATPGPDRIYVDADMSYEYAAADDTTPVITPEDCEVTYLKATPVREAAPELLQALGAIAEFCDDPHGSEKPETLAMGMARLLPAARAAIAKATGSEAA